MVLGDCEEIVTTHEIDEETDEEIVRVRRRISSCVDFFLLILLVDLQATY
jgi:hypothetical protein